jgi:hypothetical protein
MRMFLRKYWLALLAALVAGMLFGGASAIGKPVDSKSTKVQACVKVGGFTKASANAESCKLGDIEGRYNIYGASAWSSSKRLKLTVSKAESTTHLVECSKVKYPPPGCVSTFYYTVSSLTLTCTAKNAVINRVLVVRRRGDQTTFMPYKHGQHSCKVPLVYDSSKSGGLEVEVYASKD